MPIVIDTHFPPPNNLLTLSIDPVLGKIPHRASLPVYRMFSRCVSQSKHHLLRQTLS